VSRLVGLDVPGWLAIATIRLPSETASRYCSASGLLSSLQGGHDVGGKAAAVFGGQALGGGLGGGGDRVAIVILAAAYAAAGPTGDARIDRSGSGGAAAGLKLAIRLAQD
jgi:hypothetical protein